jgi:hypothetical protein
MAALTGIDGLPSSKIDRTVDGRSLALSFARQARAASAAGRPSSSRRTKTIMTSNFSVNFELIGVSGQQHLATRGAPLRTQADAHSAASRNRAVLDGWISTPFAGCIRASRALFGSSTRLRSFERPVPVSHSPRRNEGIVVIGIPNYQNLDPTGEAQAAADRMEARAREPASEVMFSELVAPLITFGTKRILEVGCGRSLSDFAPSCGTRD